MIRRLICRIFGHTGRSLYTMGGLEKRFFFHPVCKRCKQPVATRYWVE